MTPDLEALARRAVACPRWRWMQGMAVAYFRTPGVIIDGARSGTFRLAVVWACVETRGYVGLRDEEIPLDILPDLTDPATVGCLLALVREAHNAPHADVEALVAAIEAAP